MHIIHTEQRQFDLRNSEGKPLQCQDLDSTLSDISSDEDFIVSSLLTIAPERVVLHTQHPEENVIRTLIQIFEGRIIVCRGCHECGIVGSLYD